MSAIHPEQDKICPNFTHRITYTPDKPLTKYDLLEGIDRVTERAEEIINIIQSLCSESDKDGMAHIAPTNPDLIFYSLESVRSEIQDIAAFGNGLRGRLSRLMERGHEIKEMGRMIERMNWG